MRRPAEFLARLRVVRMESSGEGAHAFGLYAGVEAMHERGGEDLKLNLR